MRTIYARGKQAESPVRGKFTLVWWGAEVEEKRLRCCRGHSVRTGAAVAERELHVLPVPKREQESPSGLVREGVEDEGDE